MYNIQRLFPPFLKEIFKARINYKVCFVLFCFDVEGEGGLYLYQNNTWIVDYGRVLGRHQWVPWNEFPQLMNMETTDLPPQKGWQYSLGDEWVDDDTTLLLELTSLSPCQADIVSWSAWKETQI